MCTVQKEALNIVPSSVPGIASKAKDISDNFLDGKVNKVTAQIPKHEGKGSHGVMNEAKSTFSCRMRTDEKLTDPWICEWDLKLCFAAIHLAPREG